MKNRRLSFAKVAALTSIYTASVIGGILLPGCATVSANETTGPKPVVLKAAEYPDMPEYPDDVTEKKFRKHYEEWTNAVEKQRNQPEGYNDAYCRFFVESMPAFIKESSDNTVYSPLGLYLALGMTAETAGGNTRQQILDALCQTDINKLRSDSKALWNANYIDDGVSGCILSNSFWSSDGYKYKPEIFSTIAENYYASAFSGDPASAEYNSMFHDWLNKNTDGLLEKQLSDITFDPNMILTLASTVNYSASWEDKFNEEMTAKDVFHTQTKDVKCDFLNGSKQVGYYDGRGYTAVVLPLKNNGEMRLILPDEGLTPYDVLSDDDKGISWEPCACGFPHGKMKLEPSAAAFMTYPSEVFTEQTFADISVPKFDVCSHIDLINSLREMGITDAFDITVSDFTPLTDTEDVFIGEARQDSRAMIDENGCKAVSCTVLELDCYGVTPESIGEIKFDRPFIFEIMSETDTPLFVGVVNDPS